MIFKAREDVFAKQTLQKGKPVYMPAYDVDWEAFAEHKSKGGTMQNFPGKHYASLTGLVLEKHFKGKETIAVYPLLADNTSWWIVADISKPVEDNKEDSFISLCRKFIDACSQYHLAAYPEYFESTGHYRVWFFFEQPYPAVKSRLLIAELLFKATVFEERGAALKKLSPGQDILSGKGFGSLVTLPLHRYLSDKKKSGFTDSTQLQVLPDQFAFLQTIQQIPLATLEQCYESIFP